jgi:hypothetical protein
MTGIAMSVTQNYRQNTPLEPVMRWILPIFLFAITGAFIWCLPYVATIGWVLMNWTGWVLLPLALFVAYLGFVGPLWGKAIRPFLRYPDLPFFPPRSNKPE